jgi:threonine dehydrogenase-like Zn-dependent dehydrogenase
LNSLTNKYDLIIEATGNVKVAIESLYLLGSNGVLCFLGVYRDKIACEDFGKVLTKMVLGNRLIFGSVSSNRNHFHAGIQDMIKIQQKFKGILNMMITSRLELSDFRKAFFPNSEEIKTVINFK